MVYPGCTPEFRILVKPDGAQVLQLRQINVTTRYTGKWQDVPVVQEKELVMLEGDK